MDLPNLFSKSLTKKNRLFILTVLTDQSIHSALWRVIEQKVVIVSKSKVRFYSTQKEQTIQLDESLQDLDEQAEDTDQILFAFESNWIENNSILESHEKELKTLTDELALKAVGFVSITEAIHQYLIKDNGYFSAIVLYVGASFLDLLVIRQGKTVGSLSVGRSQDIVSDVQEALARLGKDFSANGQKLPPNIVLASAVIDQEKLRLYQQQLITLDWTQDFNFIQKPVIELIDPDRLLELITKHCGETTAQSIGLMTHAGQDETQSQPVQKEAQPSSTSFGVPINLATLPATASQPAELAVEVDQNLAKVEQPNATVLNTTKKAKKKIFSFLSLKKKTTQPSKPAAASTPMTHKKINFKLIIIISMIFGILASGVISYFVLKGKYKVEIVLTPQTKTIQKTTIITLDSSIKSSVPSEGLLKAEAIEHEVSGTQTNPTTGSKEIGEKARGEVTVFNKTDEEKIFGAGTIFKTEQLEFELTEELVVPAATVEENETGDGEVKVFGKINTNLTALEIGTDSNVGNNTEFNIEDFSDNTYSAKAVAEFSGGTSETVQTVAQEDREELLVTLKQKLLNQAKEELNAKDVSDRYIIPTDIYQVVSSEYNYQVDEEADELSLQLTLKVQALTYTTQDLTSLSQAVLESEIPENYVFVDEEPQIMSKVLPDEETDQTKLEAEIIGKAKAVIAEEALSQSLLGLTLTEAQSQLNQREAIANVEFIYSPSFAKRLLPSLPHDSNRIIVTSN